MYDKLLTFLKHLLFVVFQAFIIFVVWGVAMLKSLDDTTIYSVLGNVWSVLFFVSPFLVFLIPLVIKFVTKCGFGKTSLYAVISVLLCVLLYFGTDFICTEYCKSFTPEKWAKYPHERHYMLDDLNKKHKLLGMTRDELESLLGKSKDSPADTYGNSTDMLYDVEAKLLYGQELCFILENNIVSDIKIISRDMKGHDDVHPFP